MIGCFRGLATLDNLLRHGVSVFLLLLNQVVNVERDCVPALDEFMGFTRQGLLRREDEILRATLSSHHLTVDEVDGVLLFLAISSFAQGLLLHIAALHTLES